MSLKDCNNTEFLPGDTVCYIKQTASHSGNEFKTGIVERTTASYVVFEDGHKRKATSVAVVAKGPMHYGLLNT